MSPQYKYDILGKIYPVWSVDTMTGVLSYMPINYWYKVSGATDVLIDGSGGKITSIDMLPKSAIILISGDDTITNRTAKTTIKNLEIDGTGQDSWVDYGIITAVYANNITLSNLTIKSDGRLGVHILRKSKNILISNCVFDNSLVRLEGENITVTGCKFINGANLVCAVNADIEFPGRNIVITGNQFSGDTDLLSIGGAQGVIVSGNSFADCVGTSDRAIAIEPYSAGYGYAPLSVSISNNSFSNIRQGIIVSKTATLIPSDIAIKDNMFIGGSGVTFANGIVAASSTSNLKIVDNIFVRASASVVYT